MTFINKIKHFGRTLKECKISNFLSDFNIKSKIILEGFDLKFSVKFYHNPSIYFYSINIINRRRAA
jgi:hypothetical protein